MKCSIYDCGPISRQKIVDSGISFHRESSGSCGSDDPLPQHEEGENGREMYISLPRNKDRQRLWIEAIGEQNICLNAKSIYVCSLHFDKNDINYTLGHPRLRDDTVPTLLLKGRKDDAQNSVKKECFTNNAEEEVSENVTPLRNDDTTASSSSQVKKYKICRVCIAENATEPVQNKMETNFIKLTGIQAFNDTLKDDLPIAFCNNCWDDFFKCLTFVENARTANAALWELKKHRKLNNKNIKKLKATLKNNADEDFCNQEDNTERSQVQIKTQENDVIIAEQSQPNEIITMYYRKSSPENYKTDMSPIPDDDQLFCFKPKNKATNVNTIKKPLRTKTLGFSNTEIVHIDNKLKKNKKTNKAHPLKNKISDKTEHLLSNDQASILTTLDSKQPINANLTILKNTTKDHNYCKIEQNELFDSETKSLETLKTEDNDEYLNFEETEIPTETVLGSDLEIAFETSASKNILKKTAKIKQEITDNNKEKKIRKKYVRTKPTKEGVLKTKYKKNPYMNELLTIQKFTLEEQKAQIENRQFNKNYTTAKFKCTDCFKGFMSEVVYVRHRLKHSEQWKFECGICKYRFATSYQRLKHMYLHMAKYSCKLCDYTGVARSQAFAHCYAHKGQTFKCNYCGLHYTNRSTYLSHLRIKHVSNFVCEFCGFSFVGDKGVYAHKNLVHRHIMETKQTVPDDGPACSTCNIRFFSDEALSTHFRLSHPKPLDKKLRNEYTTAMAKKLRNEYTTAMTHKNKLTYSSHLRTNLVCDICGYSFLGHRGIRKHKHIVHRHIMQTQQTVPVDGPACSTCNIKFFSDEALSTHLRVSHPKTLDKKLRNEFTNTSRSTHTNDPSRCERKGGTPSLIL